MRLLAANCHLQGQALVPHPALHPDRARPSWGTKGPLTRPSSPYVSHKEVPEKEVLLHVNFQMGER